MFKHTIFRCLLVSSSILLLSLTGCSESTTGGTQDTAVNTDGLTQDVVSNDLTDDVGTNDSTSVADASPDTLEDTADEDTSAEDVQLEDVPIDDVNDVDVQFEETLADTGISDDATMPVDAEEDTEEDVEEDIPTPPFEQPVEISAGTDYESGELHAMTVGETGGVSIFWRGSVNFSSTDLLVSQSDPLANAFDEPVVVKAGLSAQPIGVGGDMLQHQNNFYLTWRDETDQGEHVVYFRRSTTPDFSGEDVVIDSAPIAEALWRPQLTRSENGTVCIVWERKKAFPNYDVWLRCSFDDGLTWEEVQKINDETEKAATVSSAVFSSASSLVVAIQINKDIVVKVTDDFGLTWTKATTVDGQPIVDGMVSKNLGGTENLVPSMVFTTKGSLKLAWHKPLPGATAEAYLTSSVDGLNWSSPELIPEGKANINLVRGRGSDLHASSVESILGQGDTLYMSSPDEGANWGASNPIPKSLNSTLIDHRMSANLIHGWLHIAWWESLPGNLLKQKLVLMTVEGP